MRIARRSELFACVLLMESEGNRRLGRIEHYFASGPHAGSRTSLAKFGWVSMPAELASRCTPLPSALIKYSCEAPSFDSVTASFELSGDHAGALLLPRKFATTCRPPVASDCT